MPHPLEPLLGSWRISLRARNKSAETLKTYLAAGRQFLDFLNSPPADLDADARARLDAHPVTEPGQLRSLHVDAFIGWLVEHRAASTANNRYRGLQQWFSWMVAEPSIDLEVSPMVATSPPTVPEQPVPVVPLDDIRKLLDTCTGKTLVPLRDEAIIRLFCDTGMRRSEMAGLMMAAEIDGVRVPHLDLEDQVAWILRKGRKMRSVPFGAKTTVALDRYLRVRGRDRRADLPWLWLAEKGRGAFTHWGIGQMLDRRCDAAGIPHIHPHQLRHTWAHEWRASGGSEGDLKRLGGWRSRQMLDRYGASAADARAAESHKRFGLGDRL